MPLIARIGGERSGGRVKRGFGIWVLGSETEKERRRLDSALGDEDGKVNQNEA